MSCLVLKCKYSGNFIAEFLEIFIADLVVNFGNHIFGILFYGINQPSK